jgi:nicotinamidase-related amidase
VSELILDPRRTAIVVIDLQKGIVGFPGNPHSAQSVIANTLSLLDAARSAGAQPILVHVGRSADGGDIELQLRRRDLNTIVLCGIATAFGVESTARDAYERGFEQVFAEDAMTSRTAESHANSIANIFPRMGRVRRTAEIVAALRAGKTAS